MGEPRSVTFGPCLSRPPGLAIHSLSINITRPCAEDTSGKTLPHPRSLQGESSSGQAFTEAVRATKENHRKRTPNRQKPSALLVLKPRAPSPRTAGPQSCLLCATFPKDGLGLVVANPCSDLQTSPLLNSTDPPSFLTVRQFRVPY